MAEEFSRFLNSATRGDINDFAEFVTSDHRFLQQEAFMSFLKAIEIWSIHYRHEIYDGRNEYTCKVSSNIMKFMRDNDLY